jgi:hypothetical protein
MQRQPSQKQTQTDPTRAGFGELPASLLVLAVLLPCIFLTPLVAADIPAFPGAEGCGAASIGGRGGRVIEVVNLNDSGPGSLRAAVTATDPRIVVFHVSGTIELQSRLQINNPFITIAGQTAPGDGICLKNYDLRVSADHVIIRYIRVRPGDNEAIELDAVWVAKGRNIILDHCSVSWSVDETLSVAAADDELGNVTVQWCIIAESLNCSVHSKECHGYGSLVRGGWGNGFTFHHNLYAHHRGRSPRPGNYNSNTLDPAGLFFDFCNNVVYNWGGSYAGYNADADSILDVVNGTGGIIDDEAQVGGWPTLNTLPPPADTDHDGMPDAWEAALCLDPGDAADANRDRDGYTNIEEYINWLPTGRPIPAGRQTDLNCDGTVNLGDFARLAAHYQGTAAQGESRCDLNGDGRIDLEDLVHLCRDWLAGRN